MHKNEQWVLVDTETSGLSEPIWAVEIAAQRMKGWNVDGEPFRVLLNHDVSIESGAEALHGYSREFLRRNGQNPLLAHKAFQRYAENLPIVAYNLAFDYNRVLLKEFMRLGIAKWGNRGFCAMVLARRLVFDAPNLKLDTLKEHFSLFGGKSHRALDDVRTTAELFHNVFRERLYSLGIVGFQNIAAFTECLPVAKCVEDVKDGLNDPCVWYVLAEGNRPVGPYRMRYIAALAGTESWKVTKKGMDRWYVCRELDDFVEAERRNKEVLKKVKRTSTSKRKPSSRAKRDKETTAVEGRRSKKEDRAASASSTAEIKTYAYELYGLLKGMMADGKLDDREVFVLSDWVQKCPYTSIYPICVVADKLEQVLADGIVSSDEQNDLVECINEILMANE